MSKRKYSQDFQNRGDLLEYLLERKVPNSMILQIVKPMRNKTPAEKEIIVENILEKLKHR